MHHEGTAKSSARADMPANFAVDRTIVGQKGRLKPLPRPEDSIQQLLGLVLETTPALVALVDSAGRLLYLNRACERALGVTRGDLLGKSVTILVSSEKSKWRRALRVRPRRLLMEAIQSEECWTAPDAPGRIIEWRYEPFLAPGARKPWVLGTGIDVTEKRRVEDDRRRLSARLQRAQDSERRRLARELHDSTVQKLAAISMNLAAATARHGISERKLQQILCDTFSLAENCVREVRTVSYLLHPPLMDELGLIVALKSYVRGFSERSQIKVRLKTPSQWPSCPHDVELAIFRVVQESLTNVHRHSGHHLATIKLARQREKITLEIRDKCRAGNEDEGTKTPSFPTKTGVGIAGMTERLRHLGGTLQVLHRAEGTMVRAEINCRQESGPALAPSSSHFDNAASF